jgi:signal transduction histidine kinase
VQKSSHFSDRIKSLSDLALDGSKEGKTLLFSHIADLFLQNHVMKSPQQGQMFCDILNELITDVDLNVRREVADTLCDMKSPPNQLIRILSQDTNEVSASILQKCPIDDSDLLDLVRYGTKDHRYNINKRFGLSSLVRHELAKYTKKDKEDEKEVRDSLSDISKLSLNELTDIALEKNTEIDEQTTEEILNLIRSQKGNAPKTTLADPDPLKSSIISEKISDDIMKSAEKLAQTISQTKQTKLSRKDVIFKNMTPHKESFAKRINQPTIVSEDETRISQPKFVHEPAGQVDVLPPRQNNPPETSLKTENLHEDSSSDKNEDKISRISKLIIKENLKSVPEDKEHLSIFAKVRAKFSRDRDLINEPKSAFETIEHLEIPNFLKDFNEFEKNKKQPTKNLPDEVRNTPSAKSSKKISGTLQAETSFQNTKIEEKQKTSKPAATPTPHYADDSSVSKKISNFHAKVTNEINNITNSAPIESEKQTDEKVTLVALSKAIHQIAEQMRRLDDEELHPPHDNVFSLAHEDDSHQENAITEALEKIKSVTARKDTSENIPSLDQDPNEDDETDELHVPNITDSDISEILEAYTQVTENKDLYKDCAESMADWFWETDRLGNLQYLSEESFSAFAHPAHSLIGEDLINLCDLPHIDDGTMDQKLSFASLFERRLSFRDELFNIRSVKGQHSQWLLSAIALFDIPTGRFTGFRGSAKAYLKKHGVKISAQKIKIEADDIETETTQEPLETRPIMPAIVEENHDASEALSAPIMDSDFEAPYIIEKMIAQDSSSKPALEDIMTPPVEDYAEPIKEATFPSQEVPDASQETAITDLLQNLSHELRTPLNAIIGFSEMIEMEVWGPVNEQYHTQTRHILLAARGLKEAIDNVLDSAKLDAGLMDNSPKDFSLKSIIEHSLSSVLPYADQLNVITSEKAVDFDITLHRDQNIIELCLTKIFTRALANADKGEKLDVTVRMDLKGQTIITIPLLGPPISSDQKDIMFQKIAYPSEASDLKENSQSHEKIITPGFGLSVARDLANLIGAELRIETDGEFISHFFLILKADDEIIS